MYSRITTIVLIFWFPTILYGMTTVHHHRHRRSFVWPPWQTATVSGLTDINQLSAAEPAITADVIVPLPAELLQLARDFGVRDLHRLPSLNEAQALLGTATADETVQAVLEIAATDDGRDLIREFLQSGDYVENDVVDAPSSLLNKVDATLDRTHTNLDVLRNVIGTGSDGDGTTTTNSNSYGFFDTFLGALFYGRSAQRHQASTTKMISPTTLALPMKQRTIVQRPSAVVVPIVMPVLHQNATSYDRTVQHYYGHHHHQLLQQPKAAYPTKLTGVVVRRVGLQQLQDKAASPLRSQWSNSITPTTAALLKEPQKQHHQQQQSYYIRSPAMTILSATTTTQPRPASSTTVVAPVETTTAVQTVVEEGDSDFPKPTENTMTTAQQLEGSETRESSISSSSNTTTITTTEIASVIEHSSKYTTLNEVADTDTNKVGDRALRFGNRADGGPQRNSDHRAFASGRLGVRADAAAIARAIPTQRPSRGGAAKTAPGESL